MKRRKALKHLGVGFSSAIVGTSWLASCKKDDPGPAVPFNGTVAIIGAGPAGLYAADRLSTLGINVVVLEATNQLGGRVRSLRNQLGDLYQSIADFPVELGAEYFQGLDSALGQIVGNLNLETVDLTASNNFFVLGNEVKDGTGWAGDADFSAAQNFVNNLPNYNGDGSVKSAAGLTERGDKLLNGLVGNFYGSNNERIGAKSLSDQMKLVTHDAKFYTLKHNTMQDLVISRFSDVLSKVKFNSPVKSINYSSDPVEITFEDGTKLTAEKVVVTVPVSVIKNGITFSPALAGAKASALGKIGMDACIRIVLDFKKNFWGEASGFIWGGTVAPQYNNSGFGRSEDFRTMTITIHGPKAQALSSLPTEQAIIDAVIAEIDELYDGAGTAFIRRTLPTDDDPEEKMIFFIKDWTKEKYIQGGFSYPTPGTTTDDRLALSAPIAGRLFFAGEATDTHGECGTVNGALNSAERVAEEVVKSITLI